MERENAVTREGARSCSKVPTAGDSFTVLGRESLADPRLGLYRHSARARGCAHGAPHIIFQCQPPSADATNQAPAPTLIGLPPSDCPGRSAACTLTTMHHLSLGWRVFRSDPDNRPWLGREGQGARQSSPTMYLSARPGFGQRCVRPAGSAQMDTSRPFKACRWFEPRNILVPARQGRPIASFGLDFWTHAERAYACGLDRQRPARPPPPPWIGGHPKINVHEANKPGARGKTAATAATADPPAFPAIVSWLRDQNPRLGLPTNNKMERFDSPSS